MRRNVCLAGISILVLGLAASSAPALTISDTDVAVDSVVVDAPSAESRGPAGVPLAGVAGVRAEAASDLKTDGENSHQLLYYVSSFHTPIASAMVDGSRLGEGAVQVEAPTPEPGSAGLLLLGSLGLLARRKRHTRS